MKRILSLLLTLCTALFVGAMLTACDDDSASVGGDSSVSSSVVGDDTSDSSTQEHVHSFATEWSKNETEHWHACLGADCTDVSDKAAHAYGAWADIGKGQHKKTCVCGQAVVENCEWNAGEVTKEATCDEGGEKTFTCTKCGTTKKEPFGELGHAYTVSFVWTGVTAQANVVCLNDAAHNQTLAATVTSEETPASCVNDKQTDYTATLTFEGRTHTDVKTVIHENTALGHDYALSAWQWTEYSAAKAKFVCQNDATHTQEVTATVTSATTNPSCEADGATVYTATATFEEQPYVDTKTQTLGKTGHDYAFDGFEWAVDFTSAKAKFVCRTDAMHTKKETVEVTANVTQPTCTADSYTEYSVLFRYEEITHQDLKTVTHEGTAKGHDYTQSDVVWSWAEDCASATLSLFCGECYEWFRFKDDALTSETTNPTCTQAGSTVYAASVTVNGTTYDKTNTVVIPAAHNIVNGVCSLCGHRESVGLAYEETDGGYKVTGRGTCADTQIYISESYQGQPVVAIGEEAFLDQTDITLFKVPSNVTCIEQGAFKGCSALKELTLPFVGRSANDSTYYFIGYIFGATYYEDKNCTPESLQKLIITGGKVASNALLSCGDVKEIHILEGATVQIGSISGSRKTYGALNGCTSVERLSLPYTSTNSASIALGSFFGGINSNNWSEMPTSLKFLAIRGGQYGNIDSFDDNCRYVQDVVLSNSITEAYLNVEEVTNLYYEGTQAEYEAMTQKPYNYYNSTTIYYYSEEKPTEEGNFWRWAADGVTPIPWTVSGTWTLVSITMHPSTEIIPGENGAPLNYIVFDLRADGTFTQTVNAVDPVHTMDGTWVLSSVYGNNKITLTPADTSNGGAQDFWLNSDGTMTCTTVVSGASQTVVLRKVEFLGTYTLVSQTMTDGVESETSIGGVDMPNMYVEIKADGTFTQTVIEVGETEPMFTTNGTWTKEGDTVALTANSATEFGTFYGETITLSSEAPFDDSLTIISVYKKA